MKLSALTLSLLTFQRKSAAFTVPIKSGVVRTTRAPLSTPTASTVFSAASSNDTNEGIINNMDTNIEGPDVPPISATAKRLFLVRHGEVINPGGDRPVYYVRKYHISTPPLCNIIHTLKVCSSVLPHSSFQKLCFILYRVQWMFLYLN